MRAFFLFLLCGLGSLHAAAPVVSNISAAQRANARLVDITYDVAADFPTVSVSLQVSSNGGSTFTVPATTLSGAIGAGVTIGKAKKITWDAGKDWSGQYSTQMRFKVIADDGNSAPTISDIVARTINQGGNTGAIAFTIGDAQKAVGLLTLSVSSSNTTLVPNANIVFGGSGANRTVTVTPASGQSGTATITVTVGDGSLTRSDSFILTVNANTAPTIPDIAARTINQGSNTGAIAFTVGDAQTAASLLTLSGSSSNTTLVSNANIVFRGSGTNRTVTVTPVSCQSGTATITVTVSDGSLTASDTFVLTVNSAPNISDITAQSINEGNSTSALAFTVGDAQTAPGSLIVSGSSSNTTLVPNANIVFGGSGANRTVTVTPASGQSGTATITVTVSDGSLTVSDTFVLTVNYAMVLIPQGAFTMGDSLDGDSSAPTRTVTLDAFYMGKYEVTKAEWDVVRTWGMSNGYTDLAAGLGKASNHPVHSISWYDMVKWCNARSQMEGLTPVYYTNNAQTTIYKTGDVDVTNAQVKWAANGYRLPTEAEWEKAARGGLSGKRFPWGDTISHSQANYYANDYYSYDSSGAVNNFHPTYATGSMPYTSPVGAFAANGYGLYDMVGNVLEWCWDWYGTYAAGSQTNPRGTTSGTNRVFRGGSWYDSAGDSRVAGRYDDGDGPALTDSGIGFRVLRSSAP